MKQTATQTVDRADAEARQPAQVSENDRKIVTPEAESTVRRNPLHQIKSLTVQRFVDLAAETSREYAKHEAHRPLPGASIDSALARLKPVGKFLAKMVVRIFEGVLFAIDRLEWLTGAAAIKIGGLVVTAISRSIIFAASISAITASGIYYSLTPKGFVANIKASQHFLHRVIFDRNVEKYLFVGGNEGKALASEDVTIRSTHRNRLTHFKASPVRIVRWALAALPKDLRRYSFVDFGAGRGRVLLAASRYNFKKIAGAEFVQELCEDAQLNISQFPRSLMKCRDVECLQVTATRMPLPEGPLVLYFYAPFDRTVFSRVMANVAKSFEKSPRTIYIITVDYDVDSEIMETGLFKPISFSKLDRLVQLVLSPLKIKVHKTTGYLP